MLRARRLQQQRLAEAEARGETFWTEDFSTEARVGIWHTWSDINEVYVNRATHGRTLMEGVGRLLERELDILDFKGPLGWTSSLRRYWLSPSADCPTVLEAMWHVLNSQTNKENAEAFAAFANGRMREARISFELIEGQIVEKASQELHAEIVAPTLRLLSGRAGWAKVEAAYQDALQELHGGSPEDAITDAGRALQETLTTLGCSGDSLGPLLKDAKRRNLLSAHDAQLEDAIVKIGHWVSADRSTKGDAHNSEPALQDDAWLTVHVVGALILRLVAGTER